jgi:hypothetical protein
MEITTRETLLWSSDGLKLGTSGLLVSLTCLGIAGAADAFVAAFEAGINFSLLPAIFKRMNGRQCSEPQVQNSLNRRQQRERRSHPASPFSLLPAWFKDRPFRVAGLRLRRA